MIFDGGMVIDGGLNLNNPEASFSVTPSSTSVNEGSAITFTINTNINYSNPTLYWTTSGTATTSDYSDGVLSGSVTLSNGSATVTRTSVNNPAISPDVTCVFELRTGSISGPIVATASTVTIVNTTALVSATGGTTVTSGNYKYHIFTSSGSFTVSIGGTCDVLVVGGGGAGSGNGGNYTTGGGGAGGLVWATSTVSAGSYNAVVGAGGVGSIGSTPRTGLPGSSSSILSQTAGGGYGGGYGFGGNQGTSNGATGNPGRTAASGGGGGAGGTPTNMDGGPGYQDSALSGIAGFNNTGYFAGGGAGFGEGDADVYGTATAGGGSNAAGTTNTGGGGGSRTFDDGIMGWNGGSGIVIVRYQYQ